MILQYIAQHWVEWLFAIVLAGLGALYKSMAAKMKAETAKNAAIADGVQALLRESIVRNYNKYQEKGFCPIFAKESMKRCYTAYRNLGGNDVASELYRKLLAMPEEQI